MDPADPEKDENKYRVSVGVGPLILVLVRCVGVIGGLINLSTSDLVGSLSVLLLSAAGIAGGIFWFLRDAKNVGSELALPIGSSPHPRLSVRHFSV